MASKTKSSELNGLLRALGPDLLLPLAVFYGARAAGMESAPALLLMAAASAARAVCSVATGRRITGLNAFVLGAVALSVAMTFVTGSPRVLLIRAAWGTAALGLLLLASMFAKRPLLFSAANQIFDADKRREWAANWDRYPVFRRLLRICTAVWGVVLLLDCAVRVVLASTLPVDVVPVLDDVLLVLVILALFGFQRTYGRRELRRAGLRMRGVHISSLDSAAPSENR